MIKVLYKKKLNLFVIIVYGLTKPGRYSSTICNTISTIQRQYKKVKFILNEDSPLMQAVNAVNRILIIIKIVAAQVFKARHPGFAPPFFFAPKLKKEQNQQPELKMSFQAFYKKSRKHVKPAVLLALTHYRIIHTKIAELKRYSSIFSRKTTVLPALQLQPTKN